MLRLPACAAALFVLCATAYASETVHPPEIDEMISRQAKRHGVPEKLVRRIVMRESRYNPRARNHSFWGLMQISYPTAKSMGFKGTPSQLLDPLVNLTYAVPYLANAFVVAGRQEDAAVRLYASGYYATAKNRNLLPELRTADSTPLAPEENLLVATATPVSTLFSTVVNGPASLPAAAVFRPAASPEASAPPASGKGDSGKGDLAPEIMMTSGKNGTEPPKKWLRDGGITLIAKGEQRVDQVAAYGPPTGSNGERKGAERKMVAARGGRKTAEFAALDPAPPSAAQAYAANAGDSGGIAQTAPQTAIAEATAHPVSPDAAGPAADASELKAAKTGHLKSARSRKAASAKTQGGKTHVGKTEAGAETVVAPGEGADAAPQRPASEAGTQPEAGTVAPDAAPSKKVTKTKHAGRAAKKTEPGDVAQAKDDDAGNPQQK